MESVQFFIDYELLASSKMTCNCDFYEIFRAFLGKLGNVNVIILQSNSSHLDNTISITEDNDDRYDKFFPIEYYGQVLGTTTTTATNQNINNSTKIQTQQQQRQSKQGSAVATTSSTITSSLSSSILMRKVVTPEMTAVCNSGFIGDGSAASSTTSFNVYLKCKYRYIFSVLLCSHEFTAHKIPVNFDYCAVIPTNEYVFLDDRSNIFWYNIISEIKNVLNILNCGSITGTCGSIGGKIENDIVESSYDELLKGLIRLHAERTSGSKSTLASKSCADMLPEPMTRMEYIFNADNSSLASEIEYVDRSAQMYEL